MKALCHSPHPLPAFMNLTDLHLGFDEQSLGPGAFHIYWWKVLPRLLENAPNLEVLVLDKVSCNEPPYYTSHHSSFF